MFKYLAFALVILARVGYAETIQWQDPNGETTGQADQQGIIFGGDTSTWSPSSRPSDPVPIESSNPSIGSSAGDSMGSADQQDNPIILGRDPRTWGPSITTSITKLDTSTESSN
jgi:hypothetical protein